MNDNNPPEITENQHGNPTVHLTGEHLSFLETIKKIRDESFQTLWYDKETTAYNQTSGDVHLKGSMGEYALAEYANLQVDVSPREDGDDGADHRAIILAPNYPNTPVDIDMKTASWSTTPPLLVRVDIDPDADYYVNAYIDENPHENTLDAIETLEAEHDNLSIETVAVNLSGSHDAISTLLCKHDDLTVETLKQKLDNAATVEIQGIASLDMLLGNELSKKETIKKLLTQYQDFADWQKEKCRDSRNWPSNADTPRDAITHIVNHSLQHGHDPLRSTVSLSIYGHLNYELSMWDLNELPTADDIHGVGDLENHHRNTDLDELLEDLREQNEEQYGNNGNTSVENDDDTNAGEDDNTPSTEPDRYVNGTPVHLPQ